MTYDPKIFDTLLEPVFILNESGQILYANEPAALLADISVRKMTRSLAPFTSVFLFAEPLNSISSLATVTDPTPYQELSFTNTVGMTGKVQITIQPFLRGEQPSWLVFFRDVTLEETLQKKYRAELGQKEDVIKDLQIAQEKLQDYSKNLEVMVDERTAQLRQLNQMLSALLDSLGQGFFVFNEQGKCLEVFSKACERTVECRPPGKDIWTVLKLKEREIIGFKKWMTTLFMEMLPFADLAALAPIKFPNSQGRHINLEYHPLRSGSGKIEGVVVVATDVSDLVAAKLQAESEKAHAGMIVSLVQNRQQVLSFLRESEVLLGDLHRQMEMRNDLDHEKVFRILHTLKGGAASFSIKNLTDQCHESESSLQAWKQSPSLEALAGLVNTCTKIDVLYRNFLEENSSILTHKDRLIERWIELPLSKFTKFEQQHLQDSTLAKKVFRSEFIFEPIQLHFEQYQNILESLAERHGKQVKPIQFDGGDLRIFPDPYLSLFSTFVHAFRNSIDHGIEDSELRVAMGKDSLGLIAIKFAHQDDLLRIEISDDGAGVDPKRIRERLQQKGVAVGEEPDHRIIQHIFDSEFSTRDSISETSGRGVGMDAIQIVAQELGGQAEVFSQVGRGTVLRVEVPWLDYVEKGERIKAAG